MSLSPLDSWWRAEYHEPYGSAEHRRASPLTQLVDYVAYVANLRLEHKAALDNHEKSVADDEEIKDFLGADSDLQHLANLL